MGDLVQVHVNTYWRDEKTWHDRGDWWLWIGFSDKEETTFFNHEKWLASALVGRRQGSLVEFADNGNRHIDSFIAGELRFHPIGDTSYYSWRKALDGNAYAYVYIASHSTPSTIEIKRVCKGQAQYRTVRLFDDSPIEKCVGYSCSLTREPREMWIDEAKIEGVCGDGRKAVFQYGPSPSRIKTGGSSPVIGFWDKWFTDAWKKIPLGVQFEGNRPPIAVDDEFTISKAGPFKMDILANDHDPDHDRLSGRITGAPSHGTLEANPDGTYTYTSTDSCNADTFSYRASDGLVESDHDALVEIKISIEGHRRCNP